jgi:hypothetical protein
MLVHVIEKIRATQNDFRNFPLTARNWIPETVLHTLVKRLHEQIAAMNNWRTKSGGIQSQTFSLRAFYAKPARLGRRKTG